LTNSVNDPSGAGNAAKVPTAIAPGTNAAGTANSTGSNAGTLSSSSSTGKAAQPPGSQTTGSALSRPAGQAGGRIDGVVQKGGPDTPVDAEIRASEKKLDKAMNGICRGC